MKKLAVVSGKGGTGKTMITGSLTTLIGGNNLALADCDVDAANLELLLDPEIIETLPYYGEKLSVIDYDLCVQCGSCEENCRFDAISFIDDKFQVNPIKCEGCGVCTIVCPVDAVTLKKRQCGKTFYSTTKYGPFAHARLEPGSGTTGLLVTEVKKTILEHAEGSELLLIDGPPGIGCPLIATVSNMDAVLIVTEPSLSGLHDLERVINVCRSFDVEIYVAINKYDLEKNISTKIKQFCTDNNIKVVGEIPFDGTVIRAIRRREPVTNYDCPATAVIRELWASLKEELELR